MTPRRTFLKTVAIAGAALPAGFHAWSGTLSNKPTRWQINNKFIALHFDLQTGTWQAWREDAPLVVNAFSRAMLTDGSRQTTDPEWERSMESEIFGL